MYKHITLHDRIVIEQLLANGHTYTTVALELNIHTSTVGREVCRVEGIYKAKKAHKHAACLRLESKEEYRIIENNTFLKTIIISFLKQNLSPDQISKRLKMYKYYISHTSIYRYIKRTFTEGKFFLRIQKRNKRKYGLKVHYNTPRRSIEERPDIINTRSRYGDWEGDQMVFKNKQGGRLVTLVERKTGRVKIRKVSTGYAMETYEAISDSLQEESVLSLTFDNGGEFACHDLLEKELQICVYFAHPYSSWERGSSENVNGLIRQYFPKDMDPATISNNDIQEVENILNNRPRKRLDYYTPDEVLLRLQFKR